MKCNWAGFNFFLSVYLDMIYQSERLWRTCVMNLHATLNCIPSAQHWRLRLFFDLSMTWSHSMIQNTKNIWHWQLATNTYLFHLLLIQIHDERFETPDYRNQ